MIKVKYEYSGKKFNIAPFNTAQEKELLLLGTISEPNLNNALEICGIENTIIDSLTTEEKIAMLYKYREISVGDEIHLKFKCKHCESPNENTLSISDTIKPSNITNELIKDAFTLLTEDNFQDFLNVNVDDLEINQYEKLFKEAKDTVTKFDFRKPILCQRCGSTNHIRIDKHDFVVDNMSEDSLMSIYQTYNDLIFFGKYTKQDVDTLYPFERTILISLLNKTREDMTK
jgi:hypothetical protein